MKLESLAIVRRCLHGRNLRLAVLLQLRLVTDRQTDRRTRDDCFLLVVCSNNDSPWDRFRDITTFTLHTYVTGYDFEKPFTFEKIVEIASHARFPIHM